MTKSISDAAKALGRKGGSSKSSRKQEAARENGKKGGRPPQKQKEEA
jgi:general stress protein YciG